MRHTMTWCTRFVWVALLWGCENRKTSAEHQASPRVDVAQRVKPAGETLEGCNVPGRCLDGGSAATSGYTEGILLSDRRFTLVLRADEGVPYIDVHDVDRNQRLTRIIVDDAVVVRAEATRVQWTAGGNILLTWGSGSNTANGVVYNTQGVRLLDLAGSGFSVSPMVRYLATYPTLFANNPVIRVYDLTTGRQVAQREASEDTAWVVEAIDWQGQQIVARYRDTMGQTHELRIALDATP